MNPRSVAALIRAHRRAARLTLAELAAASGVSVRAIGDLERGRSTARQGTLDALADALALDADDRATLAAAGAARPTADSVPTLPRAVPDFTGRVAELDRLIRCAHDAVPVLVHGPPGVGKTALALRAAAAFAGPVAFMDCRGTGPAPADAAELTDRLRRAAGAGLLVLDDVRHLPPLPSVPVVLTARGPLTGLDGVVRIPLEPLPADESVALLTAITGTPVDAATRAVAERCERLPLALRIAGNRVAGRPGWTMAHLAHRLADGDRRLPTLTAGDLSVEAVLARAIARLSGAARALCHRLAADDAPAFDAADAAALTGIDVATVGRALRELVEHGLITAADSDGQHRYHALVRTFAMSRLTGW